MGQDWATRPPAGEAAAEIAGALGDTTSAVASALTVMGGQPERRRGGISDLYRQGKPLREIAAEVGETSGFVGAIVSQLRGGGADPRNRSTTFTSAGHLVAAS